jgi:small subunit ribosomal protein S4
VRKANAKKRGGVKMKRQRKKYSKPSHPWEKERMDDEDKILRRYGLKRKEEIWKTQSMLKSFRRQAMNLLTASGPKAEVEKNQLLGRLRKFGLIGRDATLDDVLGLDMEKLLERRLQTLVYRKGLAQTPKQARQLILHGHVMVGNRRIDVPSYLVSVDDEGSIALAERSNKTSETPEKVEPIEG